MYGAPTAIACMRVRYGNLISVRFEKCISSNWANDGNKHVRYNQITVGLPVTGFFN